MSRITGCEEVHQVPPKVLLMYKAVLQFIEEGADLANIRVSSVTERAGIGKGTAYEYFDSFHFLYLFKFVIWDKTLGYLIFTKDLVRTSHFHMHQLKMQE